MRELIEKAQNGNLDALAELIGRHEHPVRLYAAKVALRPDLAEDVAQKAFLVALDHLASFDRSGDFLLWMRGIVRNVARQEWEKLALRSKVERDGLAELVERLAASQEPSDAAQDQDRLRALRGCMDGLPERQKQIVKLRYSMELGCKDIAQSIGSSSDAVKMTLSRIRESLRRCIQTRLAGEVRG